jgi:dTDP-4-dehydrorhamnose reductase
MTASSKSRVLLTGASGFVGCNLARYLRDDFEVYGTYHHSQPPSAEDRFIKVDVASRASVQQVLDRVKPQAVIHAAAVADVDSCERNPGICSQVNVKGTETIVEAASSAGARFIFFSTDLVFNGEKGDYSEGDEPDPTTLYGATKREAEKLVLEAADRAVVLRLALMYGKSGYSGTGFVHRLVESLKAGKLFKLFTDQYRTPLYLRDLAQVLSMVLLDEDLRGLYHLGGPERVSRWEFGQALAEVFGFREELLLPIRMEDLPGMVSRPRDCSLNSGRICERLKLEPRGIREGLQRLKEEMLL